VERILDDWFELHGDRGRMGRPRDRRGYRLCSRAHGCACRHQKGRDLKERAVRNFGMAYPEGYRKAMRTMEPPTGTASLVTLVDTPGALSASRPSSTARAARSPGRRR
jgi:acetyl-CoA carboxylase carboxyl transferase subunit alpha